jgi:hypothetical protein
MKNMKEETIYPSRLNIEMIELEVFSDKQKKKLFAFYEDGENLLFFRISMS